MQTWPNPFGNLHTGAPPAVGWWPCDGGWFRWFDGELWSYGVKRDAKLSTVERSARRKCPEDAQPHQRWMHWADSPHFHMADHSKLPKRNMEVDRHESDTDEWW